ncbi:hypothetical protein BH23THE1_BH23THE1_33930 [soil metagenome]
MEWIKICYCTLCCNRSYRRHSTLSLIHIRTKKERNEISKTAVITAGALLMIFAIAGTQILSIFGITIASFMIAGGILLFIISVELLTHGSWRFGRDMDNILFPQMGYLVSSGL